MKNRHFYLYIGLIIFFIILVYHSTFAWLFERYAAADSYYSYGLLVPFISIFLIWHKKEELKKLDSQYSHWGITILVFSLSLHFISTLFDVFFLSGFSILFLVFGISLFLFGKKITREILFPLSFLFFMFPLPLELINSISLPMSMFVVKSSVFILRRFADIPITNEGFQLFLPKGTLVVENLCSGLRSLIVMLALSSIFAYLLNANMLKKIVLFLLAFPIAIISNLIRVILLCLAVYIYGSQKTMGFFHEFTGYLVFVIAFGGLWLCWKELQWRI